MNAMILNIWKNINHNFLIDISSGDFSFSSNIISLSKVLSFISNELNKFYNFETIVTEIIDESEKMSLYIEISGLLREMGCPYVVLLEGDMESRFSTEDSIVLLLRFFLSELAAAKIIATKDPNNLCLTNSVEKVTENNNLTSIMKPALISLGIGRPPDNMNTNLFFSKLTTAVKEKMSLVPKYFLGKSLLDSNKKFYENHWNQVDFIINNMNNTYSLRRQTLLQRLDVTIQAFTWSPKAKKQMDQISKIKSSKRPFFENCDHVTLIDLLKARDYPFALINKTSSGISRDYSACTLNKHKIGPVPDRGGRTNEMEAPPPEMPAFQKRDATQPTHSRGRGYNNQSDRDRHSGNQQGGKGFSGFGSINPYEILSQNVAPQNFYEQSQNFTPVFQSQSRDQVYQYQHYGQDYHGQHNNGYAQDQRYYNNQNQDYVSNNYHSNWPAGGRGRGRGRGGNRS